MKAARLLLLGGIITLGYWASQAQALPPFKKAFEQKYAAIINNPAFKDTFQVSCNVCHVKGEAKTVRSDYGKAAFQVHWRKSENRSRGRQGQWWRWGIRCRARQSA